METNSSLPESFDMISSRVTARRVVKSSSLLKSKSASTRPSSRELAVVVPCYNEAKRLNVKAFLTFLSDWPSARLVFVNDGSGDQTLAILNYMRAEMPERINVIDLVQNSGKAEAVRQGLLFASQRGDQLIAYWDADLATPLDALIDFTRIASGFNDVEVVFGSRRRMLGHRIERTVGRRIISRACSTLARLALRLPIADTQCGAKLLRNSDALRAAIAAPFTAGWLFDVELFARIADRVADRRFAFYEMPLAAWTEISGSKVSARAVLRSGFQMLALIARNRLGLGRVKATPAPAGLARLVAVVRQDEPSNVLLLSAGSVMQAAPALRRSVDLRALLAIAATPAVAMFLSSNVANVGNLVFNMLFGRWMGPELFADLATLLTLKLSLLAVLNAVQMAVSQVMSGQAPGFGAASLRWLNRAGFVAMGLALPLVLPAALTGALGEALGIQSAGALVILILALPVTVPLCIFRGVAVGQLDVTRIVWSANLEMGVRLGGAVLFWQLGYGIEGVAFAMALSIVAGWLPVSRALGPQTTGGASVLRPVLTLAFPFAVLQAAQVLHLDGDLLVANAVLTPEEVGFVAVLSLIQRVQFFACFGLAAVLLPSVTAAALRGGAGLREAAPVAGLFGLVSLVVLGLLCLAPAQVITVLVGQAFTRAAEVLPLAGGCAVLFTFSYLCATYLAALKDRRGIWLMAGFVPLQMSTFVVLSMRDVGLTLSDMMLAKLCWQAGLSLALVALILGRNRARTTPAVAA